MKKSILLLSLLVVFAQAAGAATISYSSGLFSNNAIISADLSGDYSGGPRTPVTGLSQFDPALGTLTGVSFAITTGTFEWFADLSGDPSPNAEFEGEFTTSIQGDLIYTDGSIGRVLYGASDGIDLFCGGIDPDDSCFDSNNNIIDYAGSGFQVPRPLTDFQPGVLVGLGDVPDLSSGMGIFGTSFPVSDGMDFLEVFGEADIFDATVEVTYEFTPVPVPAAAWLFGSALGLLGWIRRKAA